MKSAPLAGEERLTLTTVGNPFAGEVDGNTNIRFGNGTDSFTVDNSPSLAGGSGLGGRPRGGGSRRRGGQVIA